MSVTRRDILDALVKGRVWGITHTGDRAEIVGVANGEALLKQEGGSSRRIPPHELHRLESGVLA